MGLSAGMAAAITAFLLVGILLAGLIFQPKLNVEAWDFNESSYPINGSSEEKLLFLLNYAILAPSLYNSEPWKFNVSGDEIKIYFDKSRRLGVADSDQRELYISMGCALENLLVAAEHFGYRVAVQYFPDSNRTDLVAAVKLVPGGDIGDAKEFKAILERDAISASFEDRAILKSDLQILNSTSKDEGQKVLFSSNPDIKGRFEDLVVQADQAQYSNVEYKSELGYWLGQGVMGPKGIWAKFAQFEVLFLDVGKAQTKKDAMLVNTSQVLGFIISDENDKVSQVKAGQLLERVWLIATTLNISIQPMSQALMVPETKTQFTKLAAPDGGYLQEAFLIGCAPSDEDHSPRRPLRDVLV